MLEAIREALWEEMERDPAVFLIGEDIGAYGGAFKVTDGFIDHFGEQRVIDTPISEAGFTGAAAGAAHMGMRPVVEMQFMDFVSCAYEPLTNYIATSRWRGSGPGPWCPRARSAAACAAGRSTRRTRRWRSSTRPAQDRVSEHGRDAKGLLKAAIRDDDPVLFFEHKKLYRAPFLREVLEPDAEPIPLGEGAHAPGGEDLTIVTYGMMVHESQKAAEQLRRRTASTSRSSTCARCCRSTRTRSSSREEDEPRADRARGHAHRRHRRRDRHAHQREGVRVAGRADPARHRHRHAGAVLAAAGGLLPAAGRRHREGGEVPGEVLTAMVNHGR
jgi:hypothetical protein